MLENKYLICYLILLYVTPVCLQETFAKNINSTEEVIVLMEGMSMDAHLAMMAHLSDRGLMAGIMLIVAPIALFLHVSMIYIILFSKKRKKYENIFYRLVVVISITDIYWCNYHMYQGYCNLMGYCLFGEIGNVVISIGAQYFFFLCMNMDLLIAFNRFSAVVCYEIYETVFSLRRGMFYVLVVAVASVFECIPTFIFGKKYFVEFQTWTFLYMPPDYIEKLIMWVELGCTYVAHSILAVLYIWSFIVYRRRIKCATTMTAKQKKEGRLLIQAVFSGIPCFVMITFHYLFPIPIVELLGGDWCLLNGPFVYLWFNHELRADWLELIRVKKPTNKIYSNINTLALRKSQEHQTNESNEALHKRESIPTVTGGMWLEQTTKNNQLPPLNNDRLGLYEGW